MDVNANVEFRRSFFIFACTSTAAFNAIAEILDRLDLDRLEYLAYGGLNIFALVVICVIWWRLGPAILRTTFNRVYVMSFSATCASTFFIWIGLGSIGVPFKMTLVLVSVPQIVGAATVAFGIDARMRWLPVVYSVTALVGLLWTEHAYIWATLSSLMGILVLVAAWREPRPEVIRSVDLVPAERP